MSVHQLLKARKALEGMKKERDKTLADYESKLKAEREKNGWNTPKGEELEKKRDALKAFYADAVKRHQEQVTEAEKVEAARQAGIAKQQAHEEAQSKAQARAAWLRNGGSPEAFEQAWPKIREEELIQKTAEALKPQRPLIKL